MAEDLFSENFVSDNGNLIIDVHNLQIMEPIKLEQTINNIPGVVTNGIFALDHANVLLCASDNGVDKTELNARELCRFASFS